MCMEVENYCLIWSVLIPSWLLLLLLLALLIVLQALWSSLRAFNRLNVFFSCGLCTSCPLRHQQLYPRLCARLTQIKDWHHKASRSIPLSPWIFHYRSLFEFLSICTTIFKEAQRVHEITRSSHLGLELEKNSALKFCHYTHHRSLVCFTIRTNKQWLGLPHGSFSENSLLVISR